ncbi:uncharacterized protein LOC123869487 [Maniola jurtina]|uniref:uncharacterized protein LOC123869487 n=1 Tax=Maniola jurtina TaxID=191418 RepID=UPI001E6878FD|nr:uncharacterized protein LOC123869487 [Maniola jurtina]
MACHDPDTILKAVRVVPEFDGNPHVLPRFISICDQLVSHYIGTEPGSELTNLSLINCILNKVTGPAARFINSNGISDNWIGIRTALINNFSDQRDETALYNDLALATQGNSTPQEYYERCQTLFSTIMTYVVLHETLPSTVEAKRALYKKLTMQAYVRGLKEPLGSRIRCMRPDSIEKALEFVQEELNATYMQSRNESFNDRKHATPKPLTANPMVFPSPIPKAFHSSPFVPPMQKQVPLQPQQQQPLPWRQNQVGQPNQHHPTRTQQMFRAPPPNYNPKSNLFRLPPRNQNQFQKPMSGVVNYTPKQLPPTNFYNRGFTPQLNNYPRETNVHEFNFHENYYDDYPDYYFDPEPYDYYATYTDDPDNYGDVDPDSNPYYDATNEIPHPEYDEKPSTSKSQSDFQKAPRLKRPK